MTNFRPFRPTQKLPEFGDCLFALWTNPVRGMRGPFWNLCWRAHSNLATPLDDTHAHRQTVCWGLSVGGSRFLLQCGSGGITPANFGDFKCQTVHFGEYLCGNWTTNWAHFAVLNTDVEAFWINFLLDSYITLVRWYWHNRKVIIRKASFYYWKYSQIISSMTKYWKSIVYCPSKQKYWDTFSPSPVSVLMAVRW